MISIIVPTYNEEDVIEIFLKKLYELKLKNFEVIIVDDSKDKTAKIAEKTIEKLRVRGEVIKRKGKLGKGSAIREGIENAKGKYLILIDADLEYPLEKIPKIVEKLKFCDIVLTKRLKKCSFVRKFLSYAFKFLIFLIFGIKEDTQSGLKGLRKEIVNKILFKTNFWLWDVEMFLKAKKHNLKICSIPIVYVNREKGKSKINFKSLVISLKELLNLWKLKNYLT